MSRARAMTPPSHGYGRSPENYINLESITRRNPNPRQAKRFGRVAFAERAPDASDSYTNSDLEALLALEELESEHSNNTWGEDLDLSDSEIEGVTLNGKPLHRSTANIEHLLDEARDESEKANASKVKEGDLPTPGQSHANVDRRKTDEHNRRYDVRFIRSNRKNPNDIKIRDYVALSGRKMEVKTYGNFRYRYPENGHKPDAKK